MQQTTQTAIRTADQQDDRKRVETVVETLATTRNRGESLSEVAHDARNMVSALGLYCDLIEEPGVLAAPYAHYGSELRLVAAASRRLVEKLVALDARESSAEAASRPEPETAGQMDWTHRPDRNDSNLYSRLRHDDLLPAALISNFAAELAVNRNLLAALAGPSIALTIDADGGAGPVRMTGEDLTRLLVNLVKNASESMPGTGRIYINLRERKAAEGVAACLVLTVEDNGPGIRDGETEKIFASGYSTRNQGEAAKNSWPFKHRGLGLAIVRSIVEMAGGRIGAANREQGGARIEIELPVRLH